MCWWLLLCLINIVQELTHQISTFQTCIMFRLLLPLCWQIHQFPPVKYISDRMMNLGPPQDRTRLRYTKLSRKKQGSTRAIYCRRKNGPIVIRKWRRSEYLTAVRMKAQVVAKCMAATATSKGSTDWSNKRLDNDHRYDTDSFLIGIDNHASSSPVSYTHLTLPTNREV